jgi:hypothetical protein
MLHSATSVIMGNVQALVRRSGIGVENRLKKIHIDCDEHSEIQTYEALSLRFKQLIGLS